MKQNLPKTDLLLFAAIAIFAGLQARAADDWPEFRGPTGQGISTVKNVPIHWSVSSNVVWKIAIPGEGWSSPVLSNGKLYLTTAVTTADSSDTSLRTICVDAKSGSVVWNFEVFKPGQDATKQIHQKNSLASPTPIVNNGRIYVHFGHMGTAALDLNGKVLWRQTSLKFSPIHGNGGSPALVDGLLVFSCDGQSDPFLAALDAKTGEVKWKTPRNTPAKNQFSFSTPLAIKVNGKTQIISPTSGLVGGYDPKDGHEIWRARYGDGFSVITRPVFAQGLLFITSSYIRSALYAIKPEGASGDVTDTHVAWNHAKGVPNTPSPVAVGDEIYFVSDSGVASCLDAKSGKVHWSERLGGGFSASPVFAEGRLYFQNEEGLGYVLKAGKTYELLAKNDLADRTLASPALADNTIFLRSKSSLWRIGN